MRYSVQRRPPDNNRLRNGSVLRSDVDGRVPVETLARGLADR